MKIETIKLLTVNRIDIIFKLLCLKLAKKEAKVFAKEIYFEHIKLITNGLYKESGSNKKSFEDYLESFDRLVESIKENGFDSKISSIPISNQKSITNGSHRVAISIYLDIKNIYVTETEEKSHIYNYEFFLKRGLSINLMEIGVSEYLNLTRNNYLAIIWPSADKKIKYLKYFNEIIYIKKIILNPTGAQNFVAEVYKNHEWVGDFEKGYNGAISKVNETFKNYSYVHLILFKDKSFSNVIKTKDQLRKKFGIKKASIHITDNDDETAHLGKIILNQNSINFINKAIPYKFISTFNLLKDLKNHINKKQISLESFVLVGDIVLGVYGIKKTELVNYISCFNLDNDLIFFKSSNAKIDLINQNIEELIYNPKYYFRFFDFKFLRLDLVKKLLVDNKPEVYNKEIKEINKIINNNKINAYFELSELIKTYKFKFIGWIIPLSKKLKFYKIAKAVYKNLNKLFINK